MSPFANLGPQLLQPYLHLKFRHRKLSVTRLYRSRCLKELLLPMLPTLAIEESKSELNIYPTVGWTYQYIV